MPGSCLPLLSSSMETDYRSQQRNKCLKDIRSQRNGRFENEYGKVHELQCDCTRDQHLLRFVHHIPSKVSVSSFS